MTPPTENRKSVFPAQPMTISSQNDPSHPGWSSITWSSKLVSKSSIRPNICGCPRAPIALRLQLPLRIAHTSHNQVIGCDPALHTRTHNKGDAKHTSRHQSGSFIPWHFENATQSDASTRTSTLGGRMAVICLHFTLKQTHFEFIRGCFFGVVRPHETGYNLNEMLPL